MIWYEIRTTTGSDNIGVSPLFIHSEQNTQHYVLLMNIPQLCK